jgi:hypothetical protein
VTAPTHLWGFPLDIMVRLFTIPMNGFIRLIAQYVNDIK